jgi:hypothetical protein
MVSLLNVELLNESARIALDDGIFNTKGFLKAIASQADFTEKMAIAASEDFVTKVAIAFQSFPTMPQLSNMI